MAMQVVMAMQAMWATVTTAAQIVLASNEQQTTGQNKSCANQAKYAYQAKH